MLRLPAFELLEPTTAAEAAALLSEHGEEAMVVAGGTDLLPNMKHRLFEPKVLVSLGRIEEMRGVRETEAGLVIGATTTLAEVARDERVPPALSQAAGLVAGPQLRTMGTLGGNLLLDSRCRWFNQSRFWREALPHGACLKCEGGTHCYVAPKGSGCYAAHSADTRSNC